MTQKRLTLFGQDLQPLNRKNVSVMRMSIRHVSMCIAAMAIALLPNAVTAQAAEPSSEPCTYQCSSNQIRFVPGQPITIEFVNRTDGLIQLERVLDFHVPRLMPQTDVVIETLVGVDDEMSMVFWDEDNRAISAVLHRPDAQTLQVELLPSGHDSDRAVHIANDGRVLIY